MNIFWGFFWIFSIFGEVNTKLEPISDRHHKLRISLTHCVLKVAEEEFQQNDLITISLSHNKTNAPTATDRILLHNLNARVNWTVFIAKSRKKHRISKHTFKFDDYIIQIKDCNEVMEALSFLKRRLSWNPHGRFLIVTTVVLTEPDFFVLAIFRTLWKFKVLNAIIMLPQNYNSTELTIFSWFPFDNNKCGNGYNETKIVDYCNNGVFKNRDVLFSDKTPSNLHGCPVKVRAVVWPPYVIKPYIIQDRNNINFTEGIEIKLMNTIASKANLTVIYSVSEKEKDWGFIRRKRFASGMMGTIINEEADIGLGGLASFYNRRFYYDSSVTYFTETTTWCVPHAMPQPKWKCLLIVFSISIWISIILTYIFTSISIKIQSIDKPKELSIYKKTVNVFQTTYCAMLGITVKKLPKTTKNRVIFILWVILCLNLCAIYQSFLISFLTKPLFEKQIESINEMVEHGYKFGLVPPMSVFFKSNTTYIPQVIEWESCSDVERCLNRVAYKRDFVVGLPRMYMIYASQAYKNKKGEELVYWSKNNLFTYPIEMIMVKGYFLTGRINQLITRINEAGLLSKWTRDFLRASRMYDDDDDNKDDDVILTANHLEGAFIMLGIGLGISTVLFTLELLYYKNKSYVKTN